MDDDARDALRKRNQERNLRCRKCGSMSLTVLDGSKCDGMPGINYKVCGACGNAQAITQRPKREKLR